MPASILFTQCLQVDFVKPLGRYEPLPNRLHVGHGEARRLMGENPEEGPVARTMRWAYGRPDDQLRLIHIRDWHETDDPAQESHLEQFGSHCLRDTPGAAFAFPTLDGDKDVPVVDSPTLNDFHGTSLEEVLRPLAGVPRRVGITGVWTEAKVSYLAYELRTRYPEFQVAVCSALSASSSRHHHFQALDQLGRILGVRVFPSVGDFIDFLGGGGEDAPLLGIHQQFPRIEVEGLELELDSSDDTLLRYLFRDCRELKLKVLDGGFSGNVVVGTQSVDFDGHRQVPHVVKVGPQDLMGKERTSFEKIQDVLGNNAPQISDFADYRNRGAIKYRYASMGGSFSTTFQKLYMANEPMDGVRSVLDTVFGEQLMRLYQAARLEACDLLEHYGFASRWGPSVRRKVESLLGREASGSSLEVLPGHAVANLCLFYEQTLDTLSRRPGDRCYQAYVHGDLNGANILVDSHRNVWVIDFFHTRRAHVLMDLVKLENDLLYIFTPLADESELAEAFRLTDALLEVEDVAAPLPRPAPSSLPWMRRAWETVGILRAYYPELVHTDRDPFQMWVAQLRYAAHTLGFDESSPLQRRWALYTAGRCVERITERVRRSERLRVDALDFSRTEPGRLGMTLLPGRQDYGRDLEADLAALREDGWDRILCLVPQEELERYGVRSLLDDYRELGFGVRHLPIVDQKVCAPGEMAGAVRWMDRELKSGGSMVVHCVGGLGRSGMAVACLLRHRGASPEEALAEVRAVRSQRAVETRLQEEFVAGFSEQVSPRL